MAIHLDIMSIVPWGNKKLKPQTIQNMKSLKQEQQKRIHHEKTMNYQN